MKRSTVGIDRAVTMALAILLIVGGAAVLGWRLHVDLARDAFAHADRQWYAGAPAEPWWDWSLAVVTVATLGLGLWLLIANLRLNRMGAVPLAGTDSFGTLAVNPGQLGDAAAAMLEQNLMVASASARAVVDRGCQVLRLTITAEAEISLDQLRRIAQTSAADIVSAVEGADVSLQFFVRYLPARRG